MGMVNDILPPVVKEESCTLEHFDAFQMWNSSTLLGIDCFSGIPQENGESKFGPQIIKKRYLSDDSR
jgi:hypothetical protein